MHPLTDVSEVRGRDKVLVQRILDGDRDAMQEFLGLHYAWIKNLAWRMVLSPMVAEDVAQDVMVKLLTRLSSYNPEKGALRTWLYRIVVNHILNMKRTEMETLVPDFEAYGKGLDSISDDLEHPDPEKDPYFHTLVQESKNSCMAGMLICLDREQRMVYVLGDIFQVPDRAGAELMDISPDAFRQRLVRARKDIYKFMNGKCGLVNKANPCRCPKKTNGFIKAGWVDPSNLRFYGERLHSIAQVSPSKSEVCDQFYEEEYPRLFREHPFDEVDSAVELGRKIIGHAKVKAVFEF